MEFRDRDRKRPFAALLCRCAGTACALGIGWSLWQVFAAEGLSPLFHLVFRLPVYVGCTLFLFRAATHIERAADSDLTTADKARQDFTNLVDCIVILCAAAIALQAVVLVVHRNTLGVVALTIVLLCLVGFRAGMRNAKPSVQQAVNLITVFVVCAVAVFWFPLLMLVLSIVG